ncbi:jg18091 [Pararge aegeria aegeria]|uniref:Jg18091 protein n=1 Tax=Pararge aegeria aegeria TaxID=348720 RepID=A0A8S4RZ30_9NEOP|nr:jg18091 [Pararge aegeria aegeria]
MKRLQCGEKKVHFNHTNLLEAELVCNVDDFSIAAVRMNAFHAVYNAGRGSGGRGAMIGHMGRPRAHDAPAVDRRSGYRCNYRHTMTHRVIDTRDGLDGHVPCLVLPCTVDKAVCTEDAGAARLEAVLVAMVERKARALHAEQARRRARTHPLLLLLRSHVSDGQSGDSLKVSLLKPETENGSEIDPAVSEPIRNIPTQFLFYINIDKLLRDYYVNYKPEVVKLGPAPDLFPFVLELPSNRTIEMVSAYTCAL